MSVQDGKHKQERSWKTLQDLELWLQTPMIVLSCVWLLLVLSEFVWGGSRLLEVFGIGIWIIFIAEFGLRLLLAPDKPRFLRKM